MSASLIHTDLDKPEETENRNQERQYDQDKLLHKSELEIDKVTTLARHHLIGEDYQKSVERIVEIPLAELWNFHLLMASKPLNEQHKGDKCKDEKNFS